MRIDMQGWHEKLLRRTQSKGTIEAYDSGVKHFEQFCKERLDTTVELALDALAANGSDVYVTLDKFVGYAMNDGTHAMPSTVRRYIVGVKSFLRYHGIEISNERFKDKVTLPVIEEIEDVPLERKDMRTILISPAPLSVRVACAIMKDAGTRIGETLKIRVKYIHLDESPVRIEIKKDTTKATKSGRHEREVFVTSEAADLIRSLILQRNRQPEDKLFTFPPTKFREKLNAWTEKLGLGAKIEGHVYHQVHPHVFRKYFFSNSVGAIGETAAHALMGHAFYLKTYYKRPLADRQADYMKAIPNLLCLGASNMEDLRKKLLFDQLRVVFGVSDTQLKSIEDMMAKKNAFEPDEEVMREIRRMVGERWGGFNGRDNKSAGVF